MEKDNTNVMITYKVVSELTLQQAIGRGVKEIGGTLLWKLLSRKQ